MADNIAPQPIVLLTTDGSEHRYVAETLAAAFPEALRAIVVAHPSPQPLAARWRRYRRRYSLTQLGSRVLARGYKAMTGQAAHRASAAARILFPGGDTGAMPCPDLLHIVPSHNGPDCLALLDRLAPDAIAVYGTGVISEPVMRLARRGILNLHTGVSPRYRGSDSVFWALHNREPEWIGATVHVLEAGLDAGPILATGRTPLAADDDEDTLFFKTVALGAGLYADAIRAWQSGKAVPVPQRLEQGREYRFVDRTLTAELRVARLLRGGLLRRAAGR